jgi:hypothetical protein
MVVLDGIPYLENAVMSVFTMCRSMASKHHGKCRNRATIDIGPDSIYLLLSNAIMVTTTIPIRIGVNK